jgi:hypothetical protein
MGREAAHYVHGHAGAELSPTYNSWRKMVERCNNPKDISYHNYGALGITVCDKWKKFAGFLEDMGERPEGASLDRINSSGPYRLENCRWSSRKVQANNKRTNRLITYNGETKTMSEWSEITGVKVGTIWRRLEAQKSPEEALHLGNLKHLGRGLKRKSGNT